MRSFSNKAAHANYHVAKINGKTYFTGPETMLNFYGKGLPHISKVYPLFGNDENRKANNGKLEEALPVRCLPFTIFSRFPLNETMVLREGKSFILDFSEGFAQKVQIPRKFLTDEIKSQSNIIFTVSKGISVIDNGNNNYTYFIGDVNDMQYGTIPKNGAAEARDYPILFGKWAENLKVYLHTPDADVKVGLVSTGVTEDFPSVHVPFRSSADNQVLLERKRAKLAK